MNFAPEHPVARRGHRWATVRLAVLAAALLLVAACSDSPVTPSGPGELLVVVESPHGAEGAVLLEVSGSTPISVRAENPPGDLLFMEAVEGVTLVVLIRTEPGELSLLMEVEAVDDPPTIEVLSVVDGDDQLREEIGGYSIRTSPAGGS
jgi:hypothetical protein